MQNHNPRFEMNPDFSAHDLDENREGRLTAAQTHTLTRRANRLRLVAGVVVGALVVLALGVAIFDMTSTQMQLPCLGGLVITMLLVGATWWADDQYVRNKLREGVVSTVQGEAIPMMSQDEEGSTYRVKVGSQTFNLTEAEFHAFEPSKPYRVYYFNGNVLSFEQAGGDDVFASPDRRGEGKQREELEPPTVPRRKTSPPPLPQLWRKGESE